MKNIDKSIKDFGLYILNEIKINIDNRDMDQNDAISILHLNNLVKYMIANQSAYTVDDIKQIKILLNRLMISNVPFMENYGDGLFVSEPNPNAIFTEDLFVLLTEDSRPILLEQ